MTGVELTAHARTVIRERGIELAWIERALAGTSRTEVDRLDPTLRHALFPVTEREGRIPPRTEASMKVHLDEKADALYLRLDDSAIVESEEVQPGVALDFNAAGQVVGVEIRGLRERVPAANLRQLQFELSS